MNVFRSVWYAQHAMTERIDEPTGGSNFEQIEDFMINENDAVIVGAAHTPKGGLRGALAS